MERKYKIISYITIGIFIFNFINVFYNNELNLLYKLFNSISQIYLLYNIKKCIMQFIFSDIPSYLIYIKKNCIFYIYCLILILICTIINIIFN